LDAWNALLLVVESPVEKEERSTGINATLASSANKIYLSPLHLQHNNNNNNNNNNKTLQILEIERRLFKIVQFP
jgi:hypothetical protein